MSLSDKVVITCALTGAIANKAQCPHIPYTADEIGEEARRAYEAGAAAVHIHARTPEGAPSYNVEDYKNIYDAVTAACPIIINFSTGAVGISTEMKTAPIKSIKPAVGALNMGSMNYAKYRQGKKDFASHMGTPQAHTVAWNTGLMHSGKGSQSIAKVSSAESPAIPVNLPIRRRSPRRWRLGELIRQLR